MYAGTQGVQANAQGSKAERYSRQDEFAIIYGTLYHQL